jgi:hypothetical protein
LFRSAVEQAICRSASATELPTADPHDARADRTRRWDMNIYYIRDSQR